jgi:hypothetical protein
MNRHLLRLFALGLILAWLSMPAGRPARSQEQALPEAGRQVKAALAPVVLVHGWAGLGLPPPLCSNQQADPPAYFERLDEDLQAAGAPVVYAFLESSPCFTPPIAENVDNLQAAIQQARVQFGAAKVVLVAHSMGGIVSRAYIEGASYQNDVLALFTLGSPHQGVPAEAISTLMFGPLGPLGLGAYCEQSQPALCEFSTVGMVAFNLAHPLRRFGVGYHVIGGEAPFEGRNALGRIMDVLVSGADDGIVPTSSAVGLSGLLDRWQTDENHNIFGPRSYFARDGGASLSFTDCLEPVIASRSLANCGSFGPFLRAAQGAAAGEWTRVPFEYGLLLPLTTATRAIQLEGGETLFAVQWLEGQTAFTLVTPGGATIDPAYAAAHPAEVSYLADDHYAIYYFPNAQSGAWQMKLQAVSVPLTGTAYGTLAAFKSSVQLQAEADRYWYDPGDSAVFTATLSGNVASAALSARVLHIGGQDNVALTPQGGGVYRGTYTIPNAPGYAEVRIQANGALPGGLTYARETAFLFQISPSSIALGGGISQALPPRWPGSGLYAAVELTLGVNVTAPGRYALSGSLVDGQGNFVAHSLVEADLSAGARSLTLRFAGEQIYRSQRDGPYTLTDVLLVDQRLVPLVVSYQQDLYTTGLLDYHDFRPAQVFLPLFNRR